jgi:hypothetical protein
MVLPDHLLLVGYRFWVPGSKVTIDGGSFLNPER